MRPDAHGERRRLQRARRISRNATPARAPRLTTPTPPCSRRTFMTATVNSTRTSNTDPMRARIWLDDPEAEGAAIFVNMSATSAPTASNPYGVFRVDYCGNMEGTPGCAFNGFLDGTDRRHHVLRTRTGRRRQRHQGAAHDRDEHDQRQRQPAHGRPQQLRDVLVRLQRGLLPPQRRRRRAVLRARRARSGHRHVRVALWPVRQRDGRARRAQLGLSHRVHAFRHEISGLPRLLRTFAAARGAIACWPTGHDREGRLLGNGGAPTRTPFTVVKAGGKLTKYTRHTRTLHDMDQIKFTTFVGTEASTFFSGAQPNTQYELYWDDAAGNFKVTAQMVCGQNGCSTQALAERAVGRADVLGHARWRAGLVATARRRAVHQPAGRGHAGDFGRRAGRLPQPGRRLSLAASGGAALRARLPDGGDRCRRSSATASDELTVRRRVRPTTSSRRRPRTWSATRATRPTRCCSTAPRPRWCSTSTPKHSRTARMFRSRRAHRQTVRQPRRCRVQPRVQARTASGA